MTRRPRLITEQVRSLTPEQKDVALLTLALRCDAADWERAISLAEELRPTPQGVAS